MNNLPPGDCRRECDFTKTTDFLWNTHTYVNEYIRFADAKAAIVVAWTSAFLGVLYSAKLHRLLSPSRFSLLDANLASTASGIVAIAAFLLLAGGFVAAVIGLLPRLNGLAGPKEGVIDLTVGSVTKASKAYIFWEGVLAHESADAYCNAIRERDAETLLRDVAEHVFVLSSISRRKFWFANLAIRLALLGSFFAAAIAIAEG